MLNFRSTVKAAALIAPLALAAPALAATPDVLYGLADAMEADLNAMHKANGSKPVADRGAPELTERQPRHVYQKAREVMRKVELLHEMNDIDSEPVPDFPTHKITDKEIEEFVAHVFEELDELRPVFGVKAKVKPKAASGKTPTDVYARLDKVSHSLDGFAIRATKPFDVYRTALTAIHEIEQIGKKLGVKLKVKLKRAAGKTARDAYEKSFELLADLKHLAENDSHFNVPGGIVLPNKREGEVDAEDMMTMMNYLLAELGEMKIELGITTPTRFAMPTSGSIPVNVYDAVNMADLLIKQIEKGTGS